MSVNNVEKMAKQLKEEKEKMLKEINDKIKKKKSFTNLDSENEFLK
ncbi:MAG: hypothetical protein ACW9XH_05590 [Candidatus Nitrosopumilus sp. bin_32a]